MAIAWLNLLYLISARLGFLAQATGSEFGSVWKIVFAGVFMFDESGIGG
jgi:hypothetical protein